MTASPRVNFVQRGYLCGRQMLWKNVTFLRRAGDLGNGLTLALSCSKLIETASGKLARSKNYSVAWKAYLSRKQATFSKIQHTRSCLRKLGHGKGFYAGGQAILHKIFQNVELAARKASKVNNLEIKAGQSLNGRRMKKEGL